MSYISQLQEAGSKFESKFPGALKEIKETVTIENVNELHDSNPELSKKYWEAASCVVEPSTYLGTEDEEDELFYAKSEDDNFLKGLGQFFENPDWKHIIDLVLENGY